MAAMERRVIAGAPFSMKAREFNAAMEAAEYVSSIKAANSAVVRDNASSPGIITVRNTEAAERDIFSVMKLGSVVLSPTDNANEFKFKWAFDVEDPDANDLPAFAILLEPIAAGKMGKAIIHGTTAVLIDVVDADHVFANVTSAVTAKLKSAATGVARILYKESGTGDKWGIVLFPATTGGGGFGYPGKILSTGYTGSNYLWNVRRYFGFPVSDVAGNYEDITAYSREQYTTGFASNTKIWLEPIEEGAGSDWIFSFPGYA